MAWMDETLQKLKAIADAANAVKLPSQPTESPASNSQSVGKALAELLKQDNSLTQSIAVRISNLATK